MVQGAVVRGSAFIAFIAFVALYCYNQMSKVRGPKSKVRLGLSGYRLRILLAFNKIRNSQEQVRGM